MKGPLASDNLALVRKWILVALLVAVAGIFLSIFSIQKLLVEISSTPEPLPITLEELKEHIPWNRHLALVDAKLDFSKYYIQKWETPERIESYFVSLRPSKGQIYTSTRPLVFVQITPAQFELFQSQESARPVLISGLRLLKDPAWLGALWKKLAQEYTPEDLQKMVILDLNDKPRGNWKLLAGEAALGLGLLITSISWMAFMRRRIRASMRANK